MIKSAIIDERAGHHSFEHDSHLFKYRIDNELNIVHTAGYKNFLNLPYVDLLLDDVKIRFSEQYKVEILANKYWNTNFDLFRDIFEQLVKNREEEFRSSLNVPRKMRKFEESEKSQKTLASLKQPPTPQRQNGVTKNGSKTLKIQKKEPAQKNTQTENKKKVKRTWDTLCDDNSNLVLDYSNEPHKEEVESPPPYEDVEIGQMKGDLSVLQVSSEDESESKNPSGSIFAKIFNVSKTILEGRIITEDDLEDVSKEMKIHLMKKNVALEVCDKICASVTTKLVGKRLSSFTTMKRAMRDALCESCVQILTPNRHIDVLRDVYKKKMESKSPYSIVFCGVNGVGKSTSLSKVAFWLIENGYRVMIAACDTFRAGAVEQLKTHYRRMLSLYPPRDFGKGVEEDCVAIFERGYGRDADGIASASIAEARNGGFDVVLVDTAGRMQNNDPLMKALSKLVHYNQPDLILFVGEALVGNDGVDQLVKFNKSLLNFSNSTKARNIDAIFLTKFDTVDDQVGAALSMTYVTGQPILFIGTGQTYKDLKRLDARSVAQALMKT